MVVIDSLRTTEPVRDVPILPYLEAGGRSSLDIDLDVGLQTSGSQGAPQRISRTNFKHMYWTVCQQLAHMTSNGTPVRIGDLYASGTVSGKTPDSYGSMLELCWKGTRPLQLADGSQRNFLKDGDRVIMRAQGTLPGGVKIGFGSCEATVLPVPEF
jgi:fumarylacetoacetase